MPPCNLNSSDQVQHNVNNDLDLVPQGRKYPLSVENYQNSMDIPPSYVPTYNPHSVNHNNSNWSSNYVSPYGEYSPNLTSNHIQQSMDILQYNYDNGQDRTYYNF